jgi:hypothetical protein
MKRNSKLNKFNLKFKSFLFKIDDRLDKRVARYGTFAIGRGELHWRTTNLIRKAANESKE